MFAGAEYGAVDRLLHALVLGAPSLQKLIGSVEDEIYASSIRDVRVDRPVFVAGLPRSGSTLLLELLFGTGEFAACTYRHMPFVLTPLIWDALSSHFQRAAERRPRSHDDGVEISYDSPEAFEEVLWSAYLSRDYQRPDHLLPLGPGSLTPEFIEAFHTLARKLVWLASRDNQRSDLRYLSKNNNNFCRVDALLRVFPDAQIVVPFRDPTAQCRSLLRQHQRFIDAHRSDRFARRYMRWIGHFEFGANLRPVRLHEASAFDVERYEDGVDAWMRYWCDAYQRVLTSLRPRVHLVDYDELSAHPGTVLKRLARVIELREPRTLMVAAARVSVRSHSEGGELHPSPLSTRASEIHSRLRALAL